MKDRVLGRLAVLAALCLVSWNVGVAQSAENGSVSASSVSSGSGEHWVGTWGAAPFGVPNEPPRQAAGASTPAPALYGAQQETLREIVHISLGGSSVRVALSNEFGTAPLTISAASVAASVGEGTVRGDSLRALAFGGRPSIVIPPGAFVLSDPVNLKADPLSDLVVSIDLPAQTIDVLTDHSLGEQTNYRVPGNATMQAALTGSQTFGSFLFLKDVQVFAPAGAGVIVAFGDSITDGYRSTANTNSRWPDELARRLQADPHHREWGVMNEGISGGRVLHDGAGPSALARIGRDGIDLPGVHYIILFEAINDIGHAYQTTNARDVVSAADLIQGYQQIIARAHEHGVEVIGATITPYMGAGYSSAAGEQVRAAVNAWIRMPGHFDGLIDFDAITRDPKNPSMFSPAVDSGDHLHPADPGYRIMGDGIDLGLFGR